MREKILIVFLTAICLIILVVRTPKFIFQTHSNDYNSLIGNSVLVTMTDHTFSEIGNVVTDSASWFLFHPDDLQHRSQDPGNWWGYDFALRKELELGRLIAVDTGGDGGFSVRFTDGELTSREQKYAVKSQDFRLNVERNRLLLDGGYALPADSSDPPEDFPDQWIEIPQGKYQVTVHALAWYDEPGAVDRDGGATDKSLTSYVAVFKSVDDLAAINSLPSIPLLDPSRPEITFRPDGLAYLFSAREFRQEYPLLLREEIIFPYVDKKIDLIKTEHDYIKKARRQGGDFSLIIANSTEESLIGTILEFDSFGSSYNPHTDEFNAHLSGHVTHIVKLGKVFQRDSINWAEVEPFIIEDTQADPTAVKQLKSWFANHAATDRDYQRKVPYPSFYAEQVDYLTEPLDIGYAIADVLDLPLETKRQLLISTEKDLIKQLLEITKEYDFKS